MTKFKALEVEPGQRFGQLTVQFETEKMYQPSGQYARAFMCKCDCGQMKRVRLAHLRHNRVKSCGCLNPEQHGLTDTQLHNSWRAMKMRCGWKGYSEAHLYSERGITVCKEWRDSFLEFVKWARANGYQDGLTIDRINNEKGYDPSNCRWVTQKANNHNRRCTLTVEYHGQKRPLMEVLDELSKREHYASIRSRMKRGWTADEAIDTPTRKGNYRKAA